LLALRKGVIHTNLYVVYAMQFDVFSKKSGKYCTVQMKKSVKGSRIRNPLTVLSSLAATGA
jgi:hypothetical protein